MIKVGGFRPGWVAAALSGGTITAGIVNLNRSSQGGIDVGTNSTGNLGLTQSELDTITTANLNIGAADSGSLHISAPLNITKAAHLNLAAGDISQAAGATVSAMA